MAINRLDHLSVRTNDVEATRAFYVDTLGLEIGPRPEFPFPGLWLYHEGLAVVHVIGIDPEDSSGLMDYLGERGDGEGTGAFDHIAFLCSDLDRMRGHFNNRKIEYTEREIPTLSLHQIFLNDPNGIVVELNFPT